MTTTIKSFEQNLMAAMSEYLDDAHDGESYPCPYCIAEEMSDDMTTLLLSEMYSVSKTESKGELFIRLYSSGILYTALGHLYQKLMEEATELFQEDDEYNN